MKEISKKSPFIFMKDPLRMVNKMAMVNGQVQMDNSIKVKIF